MDRFVRELNVEHAQRLSHVMISCMGLGDSFSQLAAKLHVANMSVPEDDRVEFTCMQKGEHRYDYYGRSTSYLKGLLGAWLTEHICGSVSELEGLLVAIDQYRADGQSEFELAWQLRYYGNEGRGVVEVMGLGKVQLVAHKRD